MLFSVFLQNEILHPRGNSVMYIVSVMVCTTVLSQIQCIYGISDITTEEESRMLRDPYPRKRLTDCFEGAKLVVLINAEILHFVNGTALTYL